MSYVAMGKKQCPICGVIHDNGAEILVHKRLKDIEDQVTGTHLCKDHEKLFNDGYICLIGIEPPDDGVTSVQLEAATRTGHIVHIKREVFNDIFDTSVDEKLPIVFVASEVITELQKLIDKVEG